MTGIVSSSHLADGALPALSEIEFGLIMAAHAFDRWMTRGMGAAGAPDLAPLDVMVLHAVAHRRRAKKLADLCLVLNIEDSHTVAYALKKLEKRGFVASGRAGKERTAEITESGMAVCLAYREIRETALVKAVAETGADAEQLSRLASLLRALSGHYDQAARAAASL